MNANSTVGVVVEGGGEQVVAHVGLHALGSLADRLGLGASLSARVPQPRLRVHDRGTVLVQAMLMLAGGGEACSDIERLRAQPTLFGVVASDSTLYRSLRSIDACALEGVWEAIAETRAQVWRRSSATTGRAPVVLDLDVAAHDPRRAAEFVAATLGPLAADDPAAARLRETLRVYLEEADNAPRAAARLYTHRNTVLKRIARATELLGYPPRERRLAVELALELRRHLQPLAT